MKMEKSLIPRKKQKQGEKTFRFMTFTERIALLQSTFDVVQRQRYVQSTLQHKDISVDNLHFSYFCEAVSKWRALDNSEEYVAFCRALSLLKVHNYAQVVLLKDQLISLILEHVRVTDTPALPTLCDLLAELAKDLQDEIGSRWQNIAETLNGQLVECQDSDKVEAVFSCLALIIRILSRSAAKYGLRTILRQFMPLFNSRRTYVQEFAAQSMAFLVRANHHNRDLNTTGEALMQLACENERTARAVAFLVLHAAKRSKRSWFSWAPALLELLYNHELSDDDTRESHLRTMLLTLTKLLLQHLFENTPRPGNDDEGEKRAENLSSAKDSKHMLAALLLDRLQATTLPATSAKPDRVVRNLLIVEAALSYRAGLLFVAHAHRLISLLTSLAQNLTVKYAESDSESLVPTTLLDCIKLVLLPPSTLTASDTHLRRNLISSAICCENINLGTRLRFSAELSEMPLFEIEVLPFVTKACEPIDAVVDLAKWNAVVNHYVATVLKRHCPPSSGQTLRDYWSSTFSFSFPKLYDFCVGVVENCVRTGEIKAVVAASLTLLPHLASSAQQSTIAKLIHQLFSCILSASGSNTEGNESFQEDGAAFVLLHAFLALVQLDRQLAANCFDSKSLIGVLTRNAHKTGNEQSCQLTKLPALLLADYALTLSPMTVLANPGTQKQIFSLVRHNLTNWSHQRRLLTLRVLKACFNYDSETVRDDDQTAGAGNIFDNALLSEAVESNAFNFREKLVCFRRLEYEFVRKASNNSVSQIETAFLFLLGSLHEQFQPLWKPLMEVICSYEEFVQPQGKQQSTTENAGGDGKTNMPLFLLSLYDNVADCMPSDFSDSFVPVDIPAMSAMENSFVSSHHTQQRTSSSTTSIKYRQHLLEIYSKLAHVFERVPRVLVDRFIQFVEREYLPAVGTRTLLGEPARTMSLTKGDVDDAADDNDVDNNDEEGLIAETNSSVRLSRNDAETRLTGWLNVLAAFPNPGAFFKRNLLAQMFEQLLMSTNTSIQKAALECHLRMPASPTGGESTAGGATSVVDGRKILRKYKPNFDRILDDKTFRKELVLFSLEPSSSSLNAPGVNKEDADNNELPVTRAKKATKSNSANSANPDDDNRPQTLDAADRASVMPTMLRILIGRLKSRRALGANSTVEAKRRTIVRFISASASGQEISDFLALALLPARDVFEMPTSTTLTQHIQNLLAAYTVEKMFVLSQFYAVMSLVRVCAATLGRLAPEQVARKIFESSIIMLAVCEHFLNDETKRSRIAPHFVERLKALRALSYDTLAQTLDCYHLRLEDAEAQLLPALWQYVLWPNSQLFATDGIVHPTLLMRLCATKLSKQPKLWPLLFTYNPNGLIEAVEEKTAAENTIFGKLIRLLEFAGSGKSTTAKTDAEYLKAQSFETVLTCVLNLINAIDAAPPTADAHDNAETESAAATAAVKNLSPSHLVASLDKFADRMKLWPYYRTQLLAAHKSNAELGSALLVPYADTIMHFMLKQMQKHKNVTAANNKRQQQFKFVTGKNQQQQRGMKRSFDNMPKKNESSSKMNNNSSSNFVFTSQHLLLLRRLAQHVTDRTSCSSLATLLMLRLDRTPKPRSANALLTTTGRRKRKGPDTLITETTIGDENVNDAAAELQHRLLTQTEEILDTLCQLVVRSAQPRQFINQIFQLFASTRHMSARIKVCDLLKSCAQAVQNADEIKLETSTLLNDFVVSLAYQLNSYDRRMLNEPDYTQRVEAYKQAVVQFKQLVPEEENGDESKPNAVESTHSYYRHRDLVHLILHQACFDLMYTSDLGLREMAKEALRVMLTAFLRRINVVDSVRNNKKQNDAEENSVAEIRPKFIGDFVLALLLPILHTCLRAGDDEVRHDFIQIVRILVQKCPAGADANFDALRVLLDLSNPEHDYFDNLSHIQMHRRLTAIRKAALAIRNGTLTRVPAVNQYVLPTALVYLCNAQHVGQTNLHTVCLELLGAAAQRMTGSYLPIFMALLQRYATIMMTPVSGSGRSESAGQQNRLKFQKQAIKIVCKLLDSCPISVAEPSPSSLAVEKNDAQMLHTDAENPSDDSGVEMPQSESAALPAAVKKLVSLLMPVLDSFLALPTGGTRRQQTVADAAETDKLNDLMILKAPITVAVVKLLRKLPAELTDRLLPRIAQALANMLRSRLKSVRGAARECLQEILLTLRHVKFFAVIINQLSSVLTRGYQLHVLTYTVNHLLNTAAVQFMRPGDADEIAGAVSSLCRNELFSEVPNEEKNVEKVRQQTFEAAHTTGYSMLTILMRFMNAERVRPFLLEFLTQAELLTNGSNFGGGDNKNYRHRIAWKTSSTGARVNAAAAQPSPAPSSMLMPGSTTAASVRDSAAAAAPVGTSLWQYRVVLKKCQVALAQGLALNKGIKHEALLSLIGEMCSSALVQEVKKEDDDESSDFRVAAPGTKAEPVAVDADKPTEKAAEAAGTDEKPKTYTKPKGRPVGRRQRTPREPPQIIIADLPVVCKVFVVQLCIQVAAQFAQRNSKLLSKVKDENSKVVKAMNSLAPKILACLEEPVSSSPDSAANTTRLSGSAAAQPSSTTNSAVTRHLLEYYPQALAVLTTSLSMSLPCFTADEQRATQLLNILLVMLMQYTKNGASTSGSSAAVQNELLSGIYSCLTAFIRHSSTICEQLLLNGEKIDIILSYVEHDLTVSQTHTRLALELVRACVQQNYDLPALHGEIRTGSGEVVISRFSSSDENNDEKSTKKKLKKRYFESTADGKKTFLRRQPSLLKAVTSSSHAKLQIANSLIKTIAELGVRSVDTAASGIKQLCISIVSLYLTKYLDGLDAVHNHNSENLNSKKNVVPLDDDDRHVLMLTKLLRRAYMQFLCSNLQYEYQGGRLAALEMLDALVGNYEKSRLAKYNQPSYLFMLLARIISTDDSERCRQLARTVLVHLLQRIGEKERQSLFSLATNWLSFSGGADDNDAESPLKILLMRKMAFQVLEIFLDAVPQKQLADVQTSLLLPIVHSYLSSSDKLAVAVNAASANDDAEADESARTVNSDESQRLADHVLFGCVSVADKLLLRFSTISNKRIGLEDGENLKRNAEPANKQVIIDCISSTFDLLLHENAMIRHKVMQIAVRIVQHACKFYPQCAQNETIGRGSQYQQALILLMFKSSASHQQNADEIDDETGSVKRLLLDSITVLHSVPEHDAAFRTTLVQLLACEVELLVLSELPAPTNDEKAEEGDDPPTTNAVKFRHFISRIIRVALEEMATTPKQFSRRSLILQWLKAVVSNFSNPADGKSFLLTHWTTLLKCCMPILYRCMTNTTVTDVAAAVQVPQDAREAADFVGARLRQQVGVDAYTAAMQHVQQAMRKAKAERKQRATELALTRPDKAAQLKIKKQLQKRDLKKRKNAEMQDMRESGFIISGKTAVGGLGTASATGISDGVTNKKKKRRIQ